MELYHTQKKELKVYSFHHLHHPLLLMNGALSLKHHGNHLISHGSVSVVLQLKVKVNMRFIHLGLMADGKYNLGNHLISPKLPGNQVFYSRLWGELKVSSSL